MPIQSNGSSIPYTNCRAYSQLISICVFSRISWKYEYTLNLTGKANVKVIWSVSYGNSLKIKTNLWWHFDFSTVVNIWVVVFWVMTCSLVGGYQRFGGVCSFHPQSSIWSYCVRPYTTLRIKAVCSSETLVATYKTTRRHNLEDTIQILLRLFL
jgi:hypothetical protein